MRTSCVGVEPSRDGPCAREPRGRAAPAPRPPPSAAAWHLERPLILEGDRQDRVALVEDHRVRPADQDAQGPVVVGDAYDNRTLRVLRSEEHTSELQSLAYLVCRLLLEKKNKTTHCIVNINNPT